MNVPESRAWGRLPGSGAARTLLLAAIVASPLAALNPNLSCTQYKLDIWTADQGLPQNSVQAIAQTPDGYIWLGTQEGLVRFDGIRFVVFDRRSLPELDSNHIAALTVDRGGTLWIGTGSGGLHTMAHGELKAVRSAAGMGGSAVTAIRQDPYGNMWIATEEKGLWRLTRSAVQAYTEADGLLSDKVFSLATDSQGRLWVGSNKGLNYIEAGRLHQIAQKEGLPEGSVMAIAEDAQGRLWVATARGVIATVYEGQVEIVRDHLEPAAWSLLADGDQNNWLGTAGGGIIRIRDGAQSELTVANGLSDGMILTLMEDREGSLWIGTSAGGLNRLSDPKFTNIGPPEGLPREVASCVCESADGSVWIGMDQSGVGVLKNGRIKHLTTAEGLSSNAVVTQLCAKDGTVWIGTDGGGLNRISPDGSIKIYKKTDGLPDDTIWSLAEDDAGGLWIGTYGDGLAHMAGGKTRIWTTADGLSHGRILSITPSKDGSVWVGTDGGGINRLKDDTFSVIGAAQGLSNNIVLSMLEDPDGTLWIGTYGGGLNRLSGGRVAAVTTKEGLYDDVVFSVLDDGRGSLWMSCNKGIFRVAKRDLEKFFSHESPRITSTVYGKGDGLRSVECNGGTWPSAWKAAGGRLWFPTLAGAVSIDPARIRSNPVPPSVLIENLIVDGNETPRAPPIELPPGRERFEFHYTAPSFLVPERVKFRYKLDGFDRDWIEAGNRRTAYYTSIPPGLYTFHVRACNSDGVWNEEGSSIEFRLAPYFYQTWWFVLLCGVFVVAASAGGHRFRVRRMEQRERELVRQVEERTRMLAESNQMLGERTQQLEIANESLRRLSYQDDLTGIANRRRFDEVIEDEWKRATRSNTQISLIMIDIDSFKAYNDSLGHQAGDECMRRITANISATLRRTSDLLARYGGEEFAVVLPMTDAAGAVSLAETIRKNIEAMMIAHPASATGQFVTISLGVATALPSEGMTPSLLVNVADQALYRAKLSGRNRVTVATTLTSDTQ